jgi:hypothetical protein
MALVAAERLEEAHERSARLIAEEEADGTQGTILMLCYSGRARVAIAQREDAAFERCAARCHEICEQTDSPALKALYERLREDARRAEIGAKVDFSPVETSPFALRSAASSTASKRLIECVNAQERARCALLLLLEETATDGGFLFGIRQGALEPIAAVPAGKPPEGLRESLEVILKAEFDATSVLDPELLKAGDSPYFHQPVMDLGFEPVIIFARRETDVIIAGVAAIARTPEWRGPIQAQTLQVVGDVLVENADVDPLTCFA